MCFLHNFLYTRSPLTLDKERSRLLDERNSQNLLDRDHIPSYPVQRADFSGYLTLAPGVRFVHWKTGPTYQLSSKSGEFCSLAGLPLSLSTV